MIHPSIQCVLLAAGKGTRLGSKTDALPKTLLPLSGKPLCHHIIESLVPEFVDKLIVVGGFEFPKLKEALFKFESNLYFLNNEDYQKGNLITLLKARSSLSRSFCVFNADHFYSPKILRKIFDKANSLETITVVCDSDRHLGADDMKVEVDQVGNFFRMDKKLTHYRWGYVGVTLVPFFHLDTYWACCDHVLKEEGDSVCVEKVVNKLVTQGLSVDIMDVSGSTWLEVDTEEDYRLAESNVNKILRDR